jgi:hypothetical protein
MDYIGATFHHLQAYIIKIIIKEKSQLADSSILFKLRLLTNTQKHRIVILIMITGVLSPKLDLEVIHDSSLELVCLQVLINFSL